ncbi:MAG: hypothetical protein ACYDD1_10225 [Caulobacteraceae bacterium]
MTCQLLERLHILSERYVYGHLPPGERDGHARGANRKLLDLWFNGQERAVRAQIADRISSTLQALRGHLDA